MIRLLEQGSSAQRHRLLPFSHNCPIIWQLPHKFAPAFNGPSDEWTPAMSLKAGTTVLAGKAKNHLNCHTK